MMVVSTHYTAVLLYFFISHLGEPVIVVETAELGRGVEHDVLMEPRSQMTWKPIIVNRYHPTLGKC